MLDLNAEFERACRAFNGVNFEHLTQRDKVLVAIWNVEADVNNGGFHQYFFNSGGDLAFFAPIALDAIGATQMADLVRRANTYFGEGGPPCDRTSRQERLALLTDNYQHDLFGELDKAFFAYPDDVSSLLAAYLIAP